MDETHPNVLLAGGEGRIPQADRIQSVDNLRHDVKLCRGNRHEHFAPTSEMITVEGQDLHVFQWTYSTFVAE